jgi:arsenical pump membrane protein
MSDDPLPTLDHVPTGFAAAGLSLPAVDPSSSSPEASHITRLTMVAACGVIGLALTGVVHRTDMLAGFDTLWRPSFVILSIMLSTAAAQRLGILDVIAARLAPRADQSPVHGFRAVFAFSALTSAILNNDAAVLLLTPLIISLVRRCYPDRSDLVIPFVFAIFSAAGVAPLATSNPMNLIIADYAGIGFNEYALRMAPIALAGWIIAYAILRFLFRQSLRRTLPRQEATQHNVPSLTAPARVFLVVMILSLACYPALSFEGGPVWVVAAGIAAFGAGLCWAHGIVSPLRLAATVSWPILVFLYCVFVIVLGLRNIGLVNHLNALYALQSNVAGRIALISVVSAIGSAALNNHPMALLNALAIQNLADETHQQVVAALVGGDLGPRLLPMGSLAGLLWFDSLRRLGVRVTLGQFVRVGAAVTIPTLAISCVMLLLE